MKKLIWVMALLTLVGVLVCGMSLAESSGTCGTGVNWELDDNGRLTITGSGTMNSFNWKNVYVNGTNLSVTTAPWGYNISEVSISAGVTNIGAYAFYGCKQLTEVSTFST